MQRQRVGAIAEKLGMTSLFLKGGVRVPVTILRVQGCQVVAQKKGVHGGNKLQMGFGDVKRVSKSLKGYFEKAGVKPLKVLKEFFVSDDGVLPVGSALSAEHFCVGQYVDVTGVSIGKGFAGGMKRHNFGGLRASHGVSVSHRSHGSTGNRKSPAKVFKNKKMAGHMGCDRVTVQNLQVMASDGELGVIAVKGAVPGCKTGFVVIRDALKKPLGKDCAFPGVFQEMTSSFDAKTSEDVHDAAHENKSARQDSTNQHAEDHAAHQQPVVEHEHGAHCDHDHHEMPSGGEAIPQSEAVDHHEKSQVSEGSDVLPHEEKGEVE